MNAVLPRILIYEDNQGLREGIRTLLELSGDFEVCGTFGNCDGIAANIAEFNPRLLLMDIDMPGVNGIAGISLARKADPGIGILMFTIFDDEEKIFAAIKAGADGYLLKNVSPDKLIEALHEVLGGKSPMTPLVARKVLNYFAGQPGIRKEYDLTDKEKEVLRLLVQGLSFKLIAAELAVGIETIRTHIKHIYTKLHVQSSTQAVSKAINEKIV